MIVTIQEKYPQISAVLARTFGKDYVSKTLSSPPKYEPIILGEERDYLTNTLFSQDRVRLSMSPDASIYEGGWFLQKGPTCTPWAIAGGMLALGLYPQREVMQELYRLATTHKNPELQGLSLPRAVEVVNSRTQELAFNHADPFKMSRWDPPIKLNDAYSQLFYKAGLSENAKTIQDAIKQRKVILLSVSTSFYVGDEKRKKHALVVVGFKIDTNGLFDVQVIDPARGKLWMSLEHLVRAISDNTIFTMQRVQ